MVFGTRPRQLDAAGYYTTDVLTYPPSFSHLASQPLGNPTFTDYPPYNDHPSTFDATPHPNTYNPPYTGYQTYGGPYPLLGYMDPVSYHAPTEYYQMHDVAQIAAPHYSTHTPRIPEPEPFPTFGIGTHRQIQQKRMDPINYNYYATQQAGWDHNAVTAELKRLKAAWREGVGIRKRNKRSTHDSKHVEQGQAAQEGDELVCPTEVSNIYRDSTQNTCVEETQGIDRGNAEAISVEETQGIVRGNAKAISVEDLTMNLAQRGTDTSMVATKLTPSALNQTVTRSLLNRPSRIGDVNESTYIYDDELGDVEEQARMALHPFPKITLDQTTKGSTLKCKSIVEAKTEQRQPNPGSTPIGEKRTSSKLAVLKKTPTKSPGTTNGLASLRPPKTIVRSKKPVTRPVPFSFQRGARHQDSLA